MESRFSRDEIMEWLKIKNTRTVYSAAIEFNIDPQQVWDILKVKEEIHVAILEECPF